MSKIIADDVPTVYGVSPTITAISIINDHLRWLEREEDKLFKGFSKKRQ